MYKCSCGFKIYFHTSVVLPGEPIIHVEVVLPGEPVIHVEIDWNCPKCGKLCSQVRTLVYSEK